MKAQAIPVPQPKNRTHEVIKPVDARLLRHLFSHWQPERPELLIRLRPRVQETGCGPR